jgi:CheY-like chemotaxis protein
MPTAHWVSAVTASLAGQSVMHPMGSQPAKKHRYTQVQASSVTQAVTSAQQSERVQATQVVSLLTASHTSPISIAAAHAAPPVPPVPLVEPPPLVVVVLVVSLVSVSSPQAMNSRPLPSKIVQAMYFMWGSYLVASDSAKRNPAAKVTPACRMCRFEPIVEPFSGLEVTSSSGHVGWRRPENRQLNRKRAGSPPSDRRGSGKFPRIEQSDGTADRQSGNMPRHVTHSGPHVAAAPAARPPRALVVDDDRLVAAAAGRVLGGDYEVLVLNDANEALRLLADGQHFDVILSDVMMPALSGIEFHSALLRDHPEHARRAVFMTGAPRDPVVRAFLDGLQGPWIEKPFSFDKLCSALAEAGGADVGDQ